MNALILCLSVFITDGDTLACDRQRIRVHALDCPERHAAGGPAATRALKAMLAGKRVEIRVTPQKRDRYGRTVAKVYADGQDVGCKLMRAGVCKRYARYDRAGDYTACKSG